jgi:hypothetical protein
VNYSYVTFYAELRFFFSFFPLAKRDFRAVGSCSATAMSSSLTEGRGGGGRAALAVRLHVCTPPNGREGGKKK